jgi:hypothetical protein
MRVPLRGEELRSAKGEVWIVLRCHQVRANPDFFAVDLIRQHDLKQSSRAVNLTSDEFVDFCRKEGIVYPPA